MSKTSITVVYKKVGVDKIQMDAQVFYQIIGWLQADPDIDITILEE